MRLPILLLPLLAAVAAARPPESKEYRRMNDLKDLIASRAAQLKAQAEFEAKPREEKILILFEKGQDKFEGKSLTGEYVVEMTLLKWAEAQQPIPSPAAQRVLKDLPDVLSRRYTATVEVDKKDRYDASRELLRAADSDSPRVRATAIEALRKIYRMMSGFGYRDNMDKRERRGILKLWERHIDKERRR